MLYLINMLKVFFRYEGMPKNVQSPLTNMIIHDLETYNKGRAIPYCSCINKPCKIPGESYRDIGERISKLFKRLCCF